MTEQSDLSSSATPTPDAPTEERQGRADARQNRARLLAAARAVFCERGLQGEVTEIASRAGVGAGTLYRHFPGKDALTLAVADELGQAILRELDRATEIDDARASLASIVQAGYQLVEEYGQLFLTMMSGGAPAPLYEAFASEQIASQIARVIQRGIDQGHFRNDLDVEHAIGLLYALFAPISLTQLMRQRSLPEIADASTEFFLAGLARTS